MPSQAIVDGAILDKGAIVECLQGLLREQKVKCKQAAMGLSWHSVIVKKISLPEMSEAELEESIHWEAEQYIPFDIDDVNLDFQIIEGGSSEEGKMDVLLVAAKKDKIDDYTDLLIQAGLQPVVVDLDAFALQNAWEINYDVVPGRNVALVNIGASVMNLGGPSLTLREVAESYPTQVRGGVALRVLDGRGLVGAQVDQSKGLGVRFRAGAREMWWL